MSLERMADVLGFRILCKSPKRAASLARELGSIPQCRQTRDYVDSPLPTGYRAIHVIIRHSFRDGQHNADISVDVEVQIRTHYQNYWAILSEQFGEQVKEGGGEDDVRGFLLGVGHRIAAFENESPESQQSGFLSPSRDLVLLPSRIAGQEEFFCALYKPQEWARALGRLSLMEADGWEGAKKAIMLIAIGGIPTVSVSHSLLIDAGCLVAPDFLPAELQSLRAWRDHNAI